FDGFMWVVNQTSNNATKYDIDNNSFTEGPTNAPLVAPYTYSDFTGFALRTFTRPNGSYTVIYPGCPNTSTVWGDLTVTGTAPPGTQLKVRARPAATQAGLSTATYSNLVTITPGMPLALSTLVSGGSFIEIEVDLISLDGVSSPTLSGLSITWQCPGAACTDP